MTKAEWKEARDRELAIYDKALKENQAILDELCRAIEWLQREKEACKRAFAAMEPYTIGE